MRKLINPREIWQREDEDFSPWLANNLDLLDKILDTKLDLIGQERRVGPFFADLLCLNRVDNSHVVIENQLERSDHKHLGQLLTYAAGLQATTIIWIATAFENEHRNALEWLNDNMNKRFRCFGVGLELNAIGDSSCVPTFTLIAGPRNRTQQWINNPSTMLGSSTQQGIKDRPTVIGGYNTEPPYWSAFREFCHKNGNGLIPWERNEAPSYFGFHIASISNFWFGAWRNNLGTEIAAKLFMKKENAMDFDRLKAQQNAIESEISGLLESLEWNKNPRYSPHPQVGFYRRGLPRDQKDWHSQFRWLLTALQDLDRIFRGRIAEIVSSRG